MLKRVFDAFFQVKNSAYSNSGLGIGLSLTKQLVELHGGTIEAQSQLGHGSTFFVRLPESPDLRAQVSALHHTQTKWSGGRSEKDLRNGKHILIVDDNQVAAQGLRELLNLRGYTAQVAYTGERALAEVHKQPPDVVILDIGLPGMDGYEVAWTLRQDKNFTGAIVGLSGYGDEQDRRRSAQSGFDRHLIKPVGLAEVEAVFNEIFNKDSTITAS